MSFIDAPRVDIFQAIQILKQGGVIAYPTETVYGLGCNALDALAVHRLYEIKGRPESMAIPVLLQSREELSKYIEGVDRISPQVKEWMNRFWPGPLTLIFKAVQVFPPELLGGSGNIALRVSSNPIAQKLVEGLGLPLTTTSANPSGKPAAQSANELLSYGLRVDGIVDAGFLSSLTTSTIIDVTQFPPQMIREGLIKKGELQSL